MDDPREGNSGFSLPPGLRDRAKRWFAEARKQTRRDDQEIATWRRDNRPPGDGGGSGGDGSGDCDGGGAGGGDGGGGDGGD